jgi:hypothetical protein
MAMLHDGHARCSVTACRSAGRVAADRRSPGDLGFAVGITVPGRARRDGVAHGAGWLERADRGGAGR